MAETERHYRDTKISYLFREPALSGINSVNENESGREFLVVGQQSTIILTSEPDMGGGSYTKLEYQGRIGFTNLNDSEQVGVYVVTEDAAGDLSVESEMERSDIEAILQDDESCGKFIISSLKCAFETKV
jgi:hypothetical protein